MSHTCPCTYVRMSDLGAELTCMRVSCADRKVPNQTSKSFSKKVTPMMAYSDENSSTNSAALATGLTACDVQGKIQSRAHNYRQLCAYDYTQDTSCMHWSWTVNTDFRSSKRGRMRVPSEIRELPNLSAHLQAYSHTAANRETFRPSLNAHSRM